VGAFLAAVTTIFQGVFTMLSRSHAGTAGEFDRMLTRTLHLTAVIAIPVGVGGTFLAAPVIGLLYGDAYRDSVLVLQIISWSAAIILLRGPLRLSLCAADHQQQDLRAALIGTSANVLLNILFIPRYGMIGAATATVCAEVLWYIVAGHYFSVHVRSLQRLGFLWRPLLAGGVMAVVFVLVQDWYWLLQAALACTVYLATLFVLGERSYLVRPERPGPAPE
jgi:O-antigen/teichoic acid export membrane protein